MWMYAVMSKSTGCLYGEWEAESPDVAAARCLDYYGNRRDRPQREDMDIIPMALVTRPGRKPGPQGARTARLVVRVTPADLESYQAAAGRAGVSMGEWVRQRLTWMVPHMGTLADVCAFCGHERLPYQVGGLRNGQQDPTICPACGYDKTAAAEKEHGG